SRYAHPEAGSAPTVRVLTRNDIEQFHRERYAPAGLTLIFAGEIAEHEALERVQRLFGNWTSTEAPDRVQALDQASHGRLVRVVGKADAPQSELRVGHRGLPRNVPDYFPTTVMNAVLGGLF